MGSADIVHSSNVLHPRPQQHFQRIHGRAFWLQGHLEVFGGHIHWILFVMLLCAFVSSTMLNLLPSAEPILRIVGALYILWLAIGTARASYAFNSANQTPMGFKKGFLLQAVNPKVAVYGLTIFSTFLSSAANNLLLLALLAPLFASIAFIATSTWAIAGAVIRNWLHQPKVRLLVNSILVALLIYCAIDLSGILALL
jgi:cysteine/O-acetylserine efflux protein